MKKISLLIIFAFLCASLFAGGSKEKNGNSSKMPQNNNATGSKVEFKNEEVSTKTMPVKRTWDDEVAAMEAEGNVVLYGDDYPEKIVEWLDGESEKIIKMARRPDGSYIVHVRSQEDNLEMIAKFDMYGNIIYAKMKSDEEFWFDENGNVVHAIDNDGDKRWIAYDSYGYAIHFRQNDGTEWWSEYDSYDNEIHYETIDGDEWWRDYDSYGNAIHYRRNNGYEEWNDYDEKGNVISCRWMTADKESYRETRTYDDVKVSKNSTETREIYSKTINDYDKSSLEIWYTYSTGYNDTDKWEERNFVTQIRFKADGSWSSTINGKRVENIAGEGTLRFEMLPNGKMKVTPDSGDWWLVD